MFTWKKFVLEALRLLQPQLVHSSANRQQLNYELHTHACSQIGFHKYVQNFAHAVVISCDTITTHTDKCANIGNESGVCTNLKSI